jgi:hypothetical protein
MHPFGCGGYGGDVAHGTRSPGGKGARTALHALMGRTFVKCICVSLATAVVGETRLPSRPAHGVVVTHVRGALSQSR